MGFLYEMRERFAIPGVVAHLAVVIGLIGITMLTAQRFPIWPGDSIRMEVRSCSR